MGSMILYLIVTGLILLPSPFLRTRKRHGKGWSWKEILAEALGWDLWVLNRFSLASTIWIVLRTRLISRRWQGLSESATKFCSVQRSNTKKKPGRRCAGRVSIANMSGNSCNNQDKVRRSLASAQAGILNPQTKVTFATHYC